MLFFTFAQTISLCYPNPTFQAGEPASGVSPFFNQTKHNTEQKQSVRKKIEAWLLFIGSEKPADIMRVIEKKMRENEELNQK